MWEMFWTDKIVSFKKLKYSFFGFALILGLLYQQAKAQAPFGQATIKTCYQNVTVTNGMTQINLLKTNPNSEVVSFGTTNTGDILSYDLFDYSTGTVSANRSYNFSVNLTGSINNNKTYWVVPIANPNTGVGFSPEPFVLSFVDFSYTFKADGKKDNCIVFGGSSNLELEHNLTGLCQPPTITFKSKPNSDPLSGFVPGWVSGDINTSNRWVLPNPYNFSNEVPAYPQDYCNQPYIDAMGNPATRCQWVDMEIKILPCEFEDPLCPPIVLQKEIKFCCDCDEDEELPNPPCNPCD